MELNYPKYSHFVSETPLWIVHNDGQHGLDYFLRDNFDVHTELTGLAGLFPAVSQPAQDLLQSSKLSLLAPKDRPHLQTHTRTGKVSPRAWQKARPEIIKLYVGKRRTLREVQATMKTQYGIDASEQMYKKKFKAWGLRKYSTREAREAKEAREASTRTQQDRSTDTSNHSWNGDKYNPSSWKSTQYNGHLSFRGTTVDNTGDGSAIPHINPQGSPEPLPVELFLRETRRYYVWFFSQSSHKVELDYTLTASNVFDSIVAGRSILTSNPNEAFPLLNKAGLHFAELLKRPHLRLVSHLISHCSSSDTWKGHEDLRRAILLLLVREIRDQFGQEHPLFRIGCLLLTERTLGQARPQSTRLLLEATREYVPAGSETSLAIQTATSTDYIRSRDLDSAKALLDGIILQVLTPITTNSEILRQAKYILGTVHERQGRWSDAEQLWLEVMTLSDEAEEESGDKDLVNYMMSCRRLGELYEKRGQLERAVHYLRLAVKGAFEIYGAEDPATMRALKSLEKNLVRRGERDEVARLREEYHEVYASLEEYRLEDGQVMSRL